LVVESTYTSAALFTLAVSRLPVLCPRLPICSRNCPALVNFRIMFSLPPRSRGPPAEVIQTLRL
jgi:hypothetical protein